MFWHFIFIYKVIFLYLFDSDELLNFDALLFSEMAFHHDFGLTLDDESHLISSWFSPFWKLTK